MKEYSKITSSTFLKLSAGIQSIAMIALYNAFTYFNNAYYLY